MSDMLSNAMEAIVRRFVGQRIDFLAAYPSKAVQQNADGTLELVPDSDRLPTYKRVPIRYGVPGVTATIAPGARVLLEFAGGDPQKPIATVWESASVTSLVFNGGSAGVARTGDAATAATTFGTWIAAVHALLNGTGAASKGPLVAPTDFGTITGGSTVVKAG